MKTKKKTVRLNMSVRSLYAERDEAVEKAVKLDKWLRKNWWVRKVMSMKLSLCF